MKNVKRTFFITAEEAQSIRNETKNEFTTHLLPHYELEDGSIIYSGTTFVEDGEVVHVSTINPKDK